MDRLGKIKRIDACREYYQVLVSFHGDHDNELLNLDTDFMNKYHYVKIGEVIKKSESGEVSLPNRLEEQPYHTIGGTNKYA